MVIDLKKIIATYELAPKLGEKILNIAQRQQEEIGFSNFLEAYNRVAYLIDLFLEKRHDQNLVRLDCKSDRNHSLHEIIGKEDDSLSQLINEEMQVTKDVTLKEAWDFLQEGIDQEMLQKMKKLFSAYFEIHLDLNQEQLFSLKEVIEERIQEVFLKYVKDGKILLPRRPIKRISFNPNLKIEFARRSFSDPLAFFRENIDYYGEMSRGQLCNVDRYLYLALLRKKQIVDAIPNIRTGSKYGGIKIFRGFTNPLAYFNVHPEFKELTRHELKMQDETLYDALRRYKQLEQAIPNDGRFSKQDTGSGLYRGCASPLDYYNVHKKELGNLKTQLDLRKIDVGLYLALKNWGQLEQVFPKIEENYRGYPTPFDYYEAHVENFGELGYRYDLKLIDSALFHALKRHGQLNGVKAKYERKYLKK